MKVAGIICEYNPFHNGHQYHIEQTKQQVDAVLCVMSGNFVQRGEIAVTDKFTRARCAVLGGADLVIELPTAYAVRSAEAFAYGGIFLLQQTGIVSHLSFGSESGNTEALKALASFLNHPSPEYEQCFHAHLKSGVSFPVARTAALEEIGQQATLLKNPNDVLAVEYLRSVERLHYAVEPIPVLRTIGHHETAHANMASANFLREHPSDLYKYVPEEICSVLQHAPGFPLKTKQLQTAILACLRKLSPEELQDISETSEGIERRLWQAAQHSGTWKELADACKTKRYPRTRIQRLILASFLGIQKKDYPLDYIRVLAMNQTGQQLLRKMQQTCSLPVITKVGRANLSSPTLELDHTAASLFALALPPEHAGWNDFTSSPFCSPQK